MQRLSIATAFLLVACNNAAQSPGGLGVAGVTGTVTPPTSGTVASPTAGVGGSAVAGAAGIAAPSSGTGGTLFPAGTSGSAGIGDDSDAGLESGAGGSSGGASGSTGASGSAGSAGSAAPGVSGCSGSTLLAVPSDTSARGPWPVGEKTVKFGRFSAVEVFYPATPGSDQGKTALQYDLRTFLPMMEQSKVSAAQATIASENTFRDLPLDDAHGPYPVVILVHGTASYRIASFSSEAQWASRGFVVVAADHPNLCLADYLGSNGCGLTVPALNLSGDVDSEIAAIATPSGDLAFLTGHVDAKRIALAGHSAGAVNVAQFTNKPGVEMVIALAGTHSVNASSTLKSVLFAAGIADKILSYAPPQNGLGGILYPGTDTDAYNASPGPPGVKKRLVGIAGGGHLNVTDLCMPNMQGMSATAVAQMDGVCGINSVQPLADCGTVDWQTAIKAVNDVTTAALEETLQCADRAAAISGLKARYSVVGDFKESTK